MRVDCVVVGAGPAGLAASAALADRGVDHLILERDRAGQSWRSQRWASFRLNTPGWMNELLGEQPRDAYQAGPEVVRRLERLAAAAPVREGVAVTRLAPAGDGYALGTGDGELRARAVVVATGDQNRPRRPALADALPPRVAQVHAAGYRDPGRLPDGAVLVVGSAQSGCQITEDLLAGGRRVILATSPVGRLPWRHRGRDTVEWLAEAGFFDQRPRDLPDPSVMTDAQPIVAPGGRSLSLPALARAGVTLAGRPVAVDGERVAFDASLAATIAAGDALAARLRALADESIRRRGLDAPPAEPDDHDLPVALDPPGVARPAGRGGGQRGLVHRVRGRLLLRRPGPGRRRRHAAAHRRRRARARPVVPGGCAGCAGAARASCSASPGTPPWSPTPSGPTWAADPYRNAARPSAW